MFPFLPCLESIPASLSSPLPPRAPYNQEKNRYGDVPCLDQTRVKLARPYSRPEVSQWGWQFGVPHILAVPPSRPWGSRGLMLCVLLSLQLTDYINASFMDGYKQRNAYIGTQGMAQATKGSFCSWCMNGLHLPAQHQSPATVGGIPGAGHCPANPLLSGWIWLSLGPICPGMKQQGAEKGVRAEP